ncbi:hypothetical protein IHE44_0002564, partial [Lamprotornis superbus]
MSPELISQTMVHWAQESFIQSPALVRAMFSLLHRQYDALGELGRALPKAYAISATSVPDTTALLECLGQIRSLLIVQMGPEEENLMIQSIGCPMLLAKGYPDIGWNPCGGEKYLDFLRFAVFVN